MDSHKVSLLKCTTASETLVMHRTTFLCLSLVCEENRIVACLANMLSSTVYSRTPVYLTDFL